MEDNYKDINRMRAKLNKKKSRVNLRYKYYEMKYTVQDFGISTPPKLAGRQTRVGWCTKAVDALSDRLKVKKFENDTFNLFEIYKMNNADILFDSAILSALIASCSFIYISQDDDGYPRMQVIDGANATGTIDPITNFLKEGYAILDVKDGVPTLEAYFTTGRTDYYVDGKYSYSIENNANYPLLVPIINRPDAVRPFGHSVISRVCMDLVQSASRTMKRAEVSAEFYSYPQKYVLGVSEDLDIDSWKANMSSMLVFSSDEEGKSPSVGQFSQQSMAPHLEQLNSLAKAFAGETSLTVDDLGFVSANPSSAEAIKAAHENMRLTAREAQSKMAVGFLNAGLLAASLRDGVNYQRSRIYETRVVWQPIFEPDSAMLSSIGDGAIKINQAIPDYFGVKNLEELTGIESEA